MIRVAEFLLTVLTVLLFLSMGSLARADGGLTISPPVPLYSTYKLPAETQTMTDAEFFAWAAEENELAEDDCAERAAEYRAANPARTASETIGRFDGVPKCRLSRRCNGRTSVKSYEFKTYELRYRDLNDYGGGPLLIINPYFRTKSPAPVSATLSK
jgi:hypothetical protein